MEKKKLSHLKEKILDLADSSNPNIRRMVAVAIRELNIDEGGLTVLGKYLTDKQWQIRLEAAKSMRFVHSDRETAYNLLAKRFDVDYSYLRGIVLAIVRGEVTTDQDGDVNKKELQAEVKAEIAVSMAWLDHSLVIDPFKALISSDLTPNKTAGIVGLGNIMFSDAASIIEPLALKRDEDIKVRKAAIVALGKMRAQSSFETLKKLSEDNNDDIRKEALIAINHIKPEGADIIYKKCIGDKNAGVREVACIALGNLKNRDNLGEILQFLNDNHASVRVAAARVIADWKEPGSFPSLLERVSDGSEQVQNEIATAYMKIHRNSNNFNLENYLLEELYKTGGNDEKHG